MGYASLKQHATARNNTQIIMNYTAAPSLDDLMLIASSHLETLPEEILDKCHDLRVVVDDFPDTATEQEFDLSDPYDLLAVFRAGSQIAPGVNKKTSQGDDILYLYRRPILDMWCESSEDLNKLVRQVMIGELGDAFEFSESEIDEMINRHYQGMF